MRKEEVPSLRRQLPRVLKPFIKPLPIHKSSFSDFDVEQYEVFKELHSATVSIRVEFAAGSVLDMAV